ncbi:hypothetical protein C8R45DRAFT_175211 [Mycena sanguinolenta]|nr:hypothetical protein C8R45DRAFT_175211 [Mycena sanguinolenta]
MDGSQKNADQENGDGERARLAQVVRRTQVGGRLDLARACFRFGPAPRFCLRKPWSCPSVCPSDLSGGVRRIWSTPSRRVRCSETYDRRKRKRKRRRGGRRSCPRPLMSICIPCWHPILPALPMKDASSLIQCMDRRAHRLMDDFVTSHPSSSSTPARVRLVLAPSRVLIWSVPRPPRSPSSSAGSQGASARGRFRLRTFICCLLRPAPPSASPVTPSLSLTCHWLIGANRGRTLLASILSIYRHASRAMALPLSLARSYCTMDG